MKVISISAFKKGLKDHLNYVSQCEDIIIVSGKSEDQAVVIMSIKEYNSIKETEHLLSSRKNQRRLYESINQMSLQTTK